MYNVVKIVFWVNKSLQSKNVKILYYRYMWRISDVYVYILKIYKIDRIIFTFENNKQFFRFDKNTKKSKYTVLYIKTFSSTLRKFNQLDHNNAYGRI